MTEIDLNPLIGEAAGSRSARSPTSSASTAPADGNGGGDGMTPETFARTAGFTLEDLRRLTDEIAAGEHAAVVLVEHLWAGALQRGSAPRAAC